MLTCAAARRSLQAFHDGELSVGDQIAVGAHLKTCRGCADALADLRMVGDLLRTAASGHATLSHEEAAGFQAEVVTRARAEWDSSFVTRVRGMFEDMHLVYAGLGGAAALMVCFVTMFGTMRFAANERPDSLAAMVAFLATPGSSAYGAPIDVASHARWTARFSAANETAEEDAVFDLAATLTRGERKAGPEPRRSAGRTAAGRIPGGPADEDAKLIDGLLDAVARARLGPKQAEGLPTTGNMVVWLVTHTTVRASQNTTAVDLPLPAAKKRAAFLNTGHSRFVPA